MADEDVQRIYDAVKKIFVEKTITTSNVVVLAVQAMQIVEKIPDLTGGDKKNIVIKVVKLIVNEFELDDDSRATINLVIDTTLPVAIDMIVGASKGAFDLNTLKVKLAKLRCCCGGN